MVQMKGLVPSAVKCNSSKLPNHSIRVVAAVPLRPTDAKAITTPPDNRENRLKKPLAMLGVSALVGLGALAFISSPAQATNDNCDTVVVNLSVRPDSGVKGNNWAMNTMKRTTKVCVTNANNDEAWKYEATVTDDGSFTTLKGDSPNGTAKLKGGFKGKVTGSFEAKFTAPRWGDGKLTAPSNTTSTPTWVATAFPGAEVFEGSPVANYKWTYTTCDGKGETHVQTDPENTGDITEEACVPAKPAPKNCEAYLYTGTTSNLCDHFANVTGKVNCSDVKYRVTLVKMGNDPWGLDANGKGTPGVGCEDNSLKPKTPNATPTPEPTQSGQAGGLPVTGDNSGKKIAAGGAGALLIGALAYVAFRKKRDPKFVAE